MTELILVAGAGGFIGGQLVRDLERQNVEVRAVDRKPLKNWYYESSTAENLVLDLKKRWDPAGSQPMVQHWSTILQQTWGGWVL